MGKLHHLSQPLQRLRNKKSKNFTAWPLATSASHSEWWSCCVWLQEVSHCAAASESAGLLVTPAGIGYRSVWWLGLVRTREVGCPAFIWPQRNFRYSPRRHQAMQCWIRWRWWRVLEALCQEAYHIKAKSVPLTARCAMLRALLQWQWVVEWVHWEGSEGCIELRRVNAGIGQWGKRGALGRVNRGIEKRESLSFSYLDRRILLN